MWYVTLTKTAQKHLSKIPNPNHDCIVNKLQDLAKLPDPGRHSQVTPLVTSHGVYRLRVNKYRVVFEVSRSEIVINKVEYEGEIGVIDIDKRGDVYR